MKIHLDYLEGRVEELENQNLLLEADKKRSDKSKLQLADQMKEKLGDKDKEISEYKSKQDKL